MVVVLELQHPHPPEVGEFVKVLRVVISRELFILKIRPTVCGCDVSVQCIRMRKTPWPRGGC